MYQAIWIFRVSGPRQILVSPLGHGTLEQQHGLSRCQLSAKMFLGKPLKTASQRDSVAELFLLLRWNSRASMKTLVLIALVGCSLGVLMQTVALEESFETANNQVDDKDSVDSSNVNEVNAPDDDGEEEENEEGVAEDDPER